MISINHPQLRHWLALWRAPKIGPKQFALLLQHFPELDTLFRQPHAHLKKFNLAIETLLYLKKPDWQEVDNDETWAQKDNNTILCWQDALYPPLLKEISNSPPLLFVQGDPSLLSQAQLAIVGSRSPTATGLDIAEKFSKQLSLDGLVITSGLALGIDTASHRGALVGSGKTIAVMATGMDIIYPKENKKLAAEIPAAGGALVSEFPLSVTVQAKHFPRRNRIVSGLSIGTLVVEASVRSGSLITARLANEQGREIFAIPSSIYNPNARGCHQLIQEGAKLITSTKDILEELGPLLAFTKAPNKPFSLQKNETPQQASLLACLGYEISTMDDLVRRSRLTAADISSILSKLELGGIISTVPGGYIRVK